MTEKKIEKLDLESSCHQPFFTDSQPDKALWLIQKKINEIVDKVNQQNVPFYLKEDEDS